MNKFIVPLVHFYADFYFFPKYYNAIFIFILNKFYVLTSSVNSILPFQRNLKKNVYSKNKKKKTYVTSQLCTRFFFLCHLPQYDRYFFAILNVVKVTRKQKRK